MALVQSLLERPTELFQLCTLDPLYTFLGLAPLPYRKWSGVNFSYISLINQELAVRFASQR